MISDGDGLPVYSWGYYGWGSAAEKFVQLVDRIEASRGFKPPVFADVRIARKVRAAGFRESCFEKIVGADRYRWIRGLGNQSIVDKRGPQIKIADPGAVEELLDLVIKAANERRHVIYFCGCVDQRNGKAIACHRWTVGSLLLKAATKRGVRLQTTEWPGGEPVQIAMNVSNTVVASHVVGERNAVNVPLGKPSNLVELGALPWASIAILSGGNESYRLFTGPIRFIRDQWQLPYVQYAGEGSQSTARDWKRATGFRKKYGTDPRSNFEVPAAKLDAPLQAQVLSVAYTAERAVVAIEKVGGEIKRSKEGSVTRIDLWDPRELVDRSGESRVTDDVLPALAAFPKLPHLCLFFALITDAGLKRLSSLKELKHLWLNATPITDKGIPFLTELPALESLYLNDTGITDKSIRLLKKLPSLKSLKVGGTSVSDAGVKSLLDLKGLTDLDLSDTKISENSVELLRQMTQLRKLFLTGTDISHGGVQHLRRSLPKAKITGP